MLRYMEIVVEHMKSNYPMKGFRTAMGSYIYSASTNQIARVDERMFKHIEEVNSFGGKPKINPQISSLLKDNDIILVNEPLKFAIDQPCLATEKVPMKYLRLEVTRACNLKCDYCYFSGIYPMYHKRENVFMKSEIAKKAVDLLFSNANDKADRLVISFYGGEPLLEFPLIRDTVSYAKNRFSERRMELQFETVTNGTLMNESVADFLAQERFNLFISIDGPREIHNKSRHDSENGPSFGTVYKNIKRLQTKNASYFKEKVAFRCTFDLKENIFRVVSFFENNFDLSKQNFILSPVEPTDDYNGYADRLWNFTERYYDKIPLYYLPRQVIDVLSRVVNLKASRTKNVIPLNGACYPGSDWPLVWNDGKISICDGAGESSELIIGDVDHGLSLGKIRNIVQDYAAISENCCVNCWLCRICPACYITALDSNGRIDEKVKARRCAGIKRFYERAFMFVLELIEKGKIDVLSSLKA